MWHPQLPLSAQDFNEVVVLHMEPGDVHEFYQQTFLCTYRGFRDRDRPSVELFPVKDPPDLEHLSPKVLYMLFLNPTSQETAWERWTKLCAEPRSLRALQHRHQQGDLVVVLRGITRLFHQTPEHLFQPRLYPLADPFTQKLMLDEKFLTVDFRLHEHQEHGLVILMYRRLRERIFRERVVQGHLNTGVGRMLNLL